MVSLNEILNTLEYSDLDRYLMMYGEIPLSTINFFIPTTYKLLLTTILFLHNLYVTYNQYCSHFPDYRFIYGLRINIPAHEENDRDDL